MSIGIASVGSFVPARRVDNEELAQELDTSDEWIRSHTGIGSRHRASDKETCSFMATEAAKDALAKAEISPHEVDLIIVATITPDYQDFPATANLVQENLGIKNIASFDLKAACTGFVYALEMSRSAIAGGSAKTVLVIGAEKLSSIVNWKDRSTAVLFGDGAGAALVKKCPQGSGILDSILRSDGSGARALYLPKEDFSKTNKEKPYLTMDGRKVYDFAVRVNTEIVHMLMERNNLKKDDLSYIVPHQANKRIIIAAAKRLNIPLEKYYLNMEEYANTSSASIPLALDEMQRKGLLKRGDRILTVGFGGGLTYGGNFIIW